MSEHTSNNPNAPRAGASNAARKISCEEWEALLVDFLDGTLPSGETDSFHSHQQGCASCAEMFAQAGQGREWLNFLRVEPQVSPALVAKILAQTSGAVSIASPTGEVVPASVVAIPVAPVLPFWRRPGMAAAGRRAAQPRMMMTAAMAFFSITLTLNMAGVRLGAVRLADLKPATLSNNLRKQYISASSRMVRYYDNLRFVYEMEARVKELRRDADLDTTQPVDNQDKSTPSATPPDGNNKSGGKSEGPGGAQPLPLLWGEKTVAALEIPRGMLASGGPEQDLAVNQFSLKESSGTTESRVAGQAERGIA